MDKLKHKTASLKNIARMIDRKDNLKEHNNNAVLADICEAIQEIRYGSIQIHIQDSKIVQIDKINKVRMR